MPKIEVDEMRCKGCKLCTKACPKGCIIMSDTFSKNGYYPAKLKDDHCCIGCGMCYQVCPDLAITVFKD